MSESVFTAVDRYINNLFVPADASLAATMEAAKNEGIPPISISSGQGKLLYLLAKMSKPQTILEIGTLAGFSTIWFARSLPENGKVVTLELDAHHAAVAGKNIESAGLAHKVEIRVGNALATMDKMISANKEKFDLIFIDADKPPYAEYFLKALELSHAGTVIIADNVVREGKILDAAIEDEDIVGIQRFISTLAASDKVEATILQTVGEKVHDGIAIAIVK
jgi:predicted O-methyltransferase YrrM